MPLILTNWTWSFTEKNDAGVFLDGDSGSAGGIAAFEVWFPLPDSHEVPRRRMVDRFSRLKASSAAATSTIAAAYTGSSRARPKDRTLCPILFL
jgi:hypothetical protein